MLLTVFMGVSVSVCVSVYVHAMLEDWLVILCLVTSMRWHVFRHFHLQCDLHAYAHTCSNTFTYHVICVRLDRSFLSYSSHCWNPGCYGVGEIFICIAGIAQSVVCWGGAVLIMQHCRFRPSFEPLVKGIFLLELTWVLTLLPKNSLGWEYKPSSSLCTYAVHPMDSKDPNIHVWDRWMPATKTHPACTIREDGVWLPP